MLIILLSINSSFHELKQCIVKSAHNLNSDQCSEHSTESLEKVFERSVDKHIESDVQ